MLRLVDLVVLFVASLQPALAAAQENIILAPLETRMLADGADGRFNSFSLLEAALIAGGAERGSDIVRYKRQLDELAQDVTERTPPDATARKKAQIALERLHVRLLRGDYSAGCSRLQTTLDAGDYNCVTATILYQELCQRLGLETTALAAPAHVFSRIVSAEPLDVETTCAEWFEISPDQRQKVMRSGWRARAGGDSVAGQGATSPSALAASREINPPQLVGKIYYNEGVALLAARRFEPAVAALRNSVQLDPHDDAARDNLLAAINNWALDEADHGRFERAWKLLAEGLSIEPGYEPYHTNDLHIHQKWVQQLCRRHQFAEAMQILKRGYERRPEAPVFDRGRFAVYRAWFAWLLESDRVAEALDVLDAMLKEQNSPASERQAIAELASRHAQRLDDAGRPDLAAQLIEQGLKRLGSPQLRGAHLTTPL